jgi:hypothetical protein
MPNKVILDEAVQQRLFDMYTNRIAMHRIQGRLGISYVTLRRYLATKYTCAEIKSRAKELLAISKLGENNPMYGRCRMLHHNAKPRTTNSAGYIEVFSPLWYKGSTDGNKVYEHIVVYCATHALTLIQEGYIVHHLNGDRTYNCPSNLLLMTVSDHIKYHWLIRKGDTESATTILNRSRVQENSKRSPS